MDILGEPPAIIFTVAGICMSTPENTSKSLLSVITAPEGSMHFSPQDDTQMATSTIKIERSLNFIIICIFSD